MNTNEIKKNRSFIDEKTLNLAKIRNQRTEHRNKEKTQTINEYMSKYKKSYPKYMIHEKLQELFNEDNIFEDCYYKTSLFLEINKDKLNLKKVFEILEGIGKGKDSQHQEEVEKNKGINYSCAQFIDYLYNCIIIKFSSNQFENFNFIEFENKYNELVYFKYSNPLFSNILHTLFFSIKKYLIEKKPHIPFSFENKTLDDNIKTLNNFNEKFNKSIPSSAKDFVYKDLSDYREVFFKKLDIDKIKFNKTMEEYYDSVNLSLLNTFIDNNISEDGNISTPYKKKVSALASPNTHYLDFIDYILINKNEENFPLVKNAINHGIFITSLLNLLPSSKKDIEKESLNQDELYISFMVLEMNIDYKKSFKSLIFLFISIYLGIPKSKSYKFTYSSKSINKKTYNNYYLKFEKHINRIKHYFFDNKKCQHLCEKYNICI